jgi:hypothetical protein
MGEKPYCRSKLNVLAVCGFLALGLLQGCASSSSRATSRSSAPALSGDNGLRSAGGTNPNAPFAVVEHSPRLVPRPTQETSSDILSCPASGLGITEVAANVNGRYRIVRLAFVNRQDMPCKLAGYPSVSLVSGDGAPVGSLAIERTTAQSLTAVMNPGRAETAMTEPSPSVILPAGGKAYFQLGWVTGDDCPSVSHIVIAAPGTTHSFTLNHPLAICDGRIRITAVSQDEGGNN